MNNLQELPYQLDFLTTEISSKHELVNYLNEHSTHLQHILDKQPRLTRWHFKNFDIALKAYVKAIEQKDISIRLISLESNSLFIQKGEF